MRRYLKAVIEPVPHHEIPVPAGQDYFGAKPVRHPRQGFSQGHKLFRYRATRFRRADDRSCVGGEVDSVDSAVRFNLPNKRLIQRASSHVADAFELPGRYRAAVDQFIGHQNHGGRIQAAAQFGKHWKLRL